MNQHLLPGIYLIATPIGNLSDITERAIEVMNRAHVIVCEDTRTSRVMLSHHNINKKLLSFHDHSSDQALANLINSAKEGKIIAYISDAGTPGISDPGYEIVKAAIAAEIYISHVPGPCAHIMALVLSGLPTSPYYFHGFFPQKQKDRDEVLCSVKSLCATLVFYESPRRLVDTLTFLQMALGNREAVVARELTKFFETIHRGTLNDLKLSFKDSSPKGECVIVIAPDKKNEYCEIDIENLLRQTLETKSVNEASKEVSLMTGHPKKDIYKIALKILMDKGC
jgi:16S rRNA (cytidine1402-2'-O)-methyltransferase